MKTNPRLIRMTQKVVYDPLYKLAGDDIRPYFLEEKHFNKEADFPYNVHPLAFSEYNEEKIILKLNELGWEKPDDTDPNSTNCLLNGLANQIHEDRYGYNPYAFEIANLLYLQSKAYKPVSNEAPRWKAKDALEICETIMAKFPKSKGAFI